MYMLLDLHMTNCGNRMSYLIENCSYHIMWSGFHFTVICCELEASSDVSVYDFGSFGLWQMG